MSAKPLTFLFFFALSVPVFAQDNNVCLACHGQDAQGAPSLDSEKFFHSVHGSFECIACHSDAAEIPHGPLTNTSRKKIPQTCGTCHEEIKNTFLGSVHGVGSQSGMKEAPVCTDCHGEHTIRAIKDPQSSVYAAAITKTCTNCHASERINIKFGLPVDRFQTYTDSYHGLASRLGDVKAANCASCHGWHDILPSSDPASRVHPSNLKNTCGQCHQGVGDKFTFAKIHDSDRSDDHPLIRFFNILYMILIPLVVGGMLLHNFTDYLRKIWKGHHSVGFSEKEQAVVRLTTSERWQHAFLALTFTVLAYSGFALKYPEAWWAIPFQMGGETFRKGMHRGTAVLFSLICIWHFVYMCFTRRGRHLLFARLMPRKRDLHDPLKMISYNLGLRERKPHLPYPSYIEKAEYWALIWGSLIMMVTGGLLIFNTLVLRFFGTWVTDLATMIHFYEAILATLAILVWHFYWTIFDPDVYPMNLSWLIGRLRHRFKKKDKEQLGK